MSSIGKVLSILEIVMIFITFGPFLGPRALMYGAIVPIMASPAYEYYGYAPPSNFSTLDAIPLRWEGPVPVAAGNTFRPGWEINPIYGNYTKNYGYVDNGTCYLDIIGYNDSTKVEVFDISGLEPILLHSFTVNRMQLYNTTIPAKTFFKVVSDKPIAVMVGGGSAYDYGFDLFYPSTDGGYAGYEFIFMAIYNRGRTERAAPGATIHALEKAKVTVYDSKGSIIWEREMEANTTRQVSLLHRRVYRIVSTGRIIVGTWSQFTVKAVPAPLGGFKGTYFFVWQDAHTSGEPQWSALLIVNQERPSKVRVIDMSNGQTMIEKELASRSYWFLTSKEVDFVNKQVMVTSTNDVIVITGNVYSMNPIVTNMYADVTMVGIRPNDPTTLYVISRALAFSPKATARVTVGASSITIPKGRYVELPKGLITVVSNATLIVELISQPAVTFPSSGESRPLPVLALPQWGTYLLTPEAVELTYPKPKVTTGFDVTLFGAIGVIVIIVAVVMIWKRPWRRSK
jgi:hypothetical protein